MQSADCNTPMQGSAGGGSGRVQVISRQMVRAEAPPASEEEIHLTPWDLRMLTVEYFQDGIVLPKPNRDPGRDDDLAVMDRLSPAFARALRCFYPLAGRLVVGEHGDTATVSLLCTGEGAELVHAAAPGVTAADVAAWPPPPRDTPREPVSSLFPLNGLLCVDAAASPGAGSRRPAPLLAAQVTELADAVFVAVSLNHAAGDGTTFWHFVNTWSYLARGGGGGADSSPPPPPPPPVLKRWFPDGYPVPVPLQFAKVQHAVQQRRPPPPLHECAFHFSGDSVRNLKARANAELARSGETPAATVSSLQALLAHLWRSVCRARRLEPSQRTAYVQFVGCRGRVRGVPAAGYVGNAVVPCRAASTAGEVVGNGLGRAAGLLARAVASLAKDEAALVRESVDRWTEEQRFAPPAAAQAVAAIVAGNSPRFDVYGNDFGWGKPVAVRCGPENAADGKCTVYEGRGGGGAVCLEVCLAPDAMARLVADEEFMDAVSAPPCP
ncbi:unnamed protein product [Urochloa decumbens]|uniref:Acetyltransferase n=1 Tax=Urochloa decumbens TaxID=240449 RepID=A0ABC8YYL7_9POAL